MKKILKFLFIKTYRLEIKVSLYIYLLRKKYIFTKWPIRMLYESLSIKNNLIIGRNVIIGENLFLPHMLNIVIGDKCIIGNNCTIYQGVTIGQNKGHYPTIKNDVIIYTGAKIIGNITIGNNVIVGANAVVTKNVPDNAIVGGIPARIIRYRSENDEFY